MSTILTNGLKLPDKGSVDWYSDMQNNYTILDGAVGTIADHTTALAGKAPAVHTHTKSDVTDLFNSANTWSGENTFSAANLFRKRAFTLGDNSSQIVRMEYKDTNNSRWGILSFIQDTDNTVHCDIGVHALKTDGQTVLNKSVTLLVKPDNSSEFKPINDKAIDLGTSTNQWKSVYAQNYFYNGVAWGLDKSNVWTGSNRFRNFGVQSANTIDITQSTYTNRLNCGGIGFSDAVNRFWGDIELNVNTDATSEMVFNLSNWKTNGAQGVTALRFSYNKTLTTVDFFGADKVVNLGTSTNKWKSLNGINPGALSLPDVSDGDPISTIGWSLTGARNTYTPAENGWFFIRVKGTASAKCSLNIHSGSYNDNCPTWVSHNDPTISLSTSLTVPAQKSVNLYVYIVAAEIEQLIFYPALGNV